MIRFVDQAFDSFFFELVKFIWFQGLSLSLDRGFKCMKIHNVQRGTIVICIFNLCLEKCEFTSTSIVYLSNGKYSYLKLDF